MQRSFANHTKLLAIAALSLAVTHCDKKDSKASEGGITSLTLKIRSTDTAAPALAPSVKLTSTGAGNLSFTPESYKLWISTIVLQNDDGLSNQFYICESSEADCEVDFGDAASIAAFEAKLSALPIHAGTYTKVWMNCTPNSGGYVKIKGHATLANGTKVYTANPDDNNGEAVSSDPMKAGTLKISYSGGSCGITMPLSQSLVVDAPAAPADGTTVDTTKEVPAGTTVTMTMFSNLLHTVYYAPYSSPGMGGCRLSDANHAANTSGPAFCAIYPSVFPYFGETVPTVEYYKVANSVTAGTTLVVGDSNVLVKVIKDASGTPFWASFGSFYTEDTLNYGSGEKGVSGYANSVGEFAVNADSSLKMKSQENGFSAFQRADHTGEVKGEGISNGAGTGTSVTYYYHAFPFTP